MGHDGASALHQAAMRGNLRMVQLLVAHGADLNLQMVGEERSSLGTPLHEAIRFSCLDVVQFLLSSPGCNPNIKDQNGEMPIHYAVAPAINWNFHSQQILTLLLTPPKVDPNGRDDGDGDDRFLYFFGSPVIKSSVKGRNIFRK